jgi:aminopeptidase YwaD
MRYLNLVLVFLLLSFNALQAQNKNFVRDIINKLASESFHGRGYVNNGDDLAASFIAEIYDSLELKKVSDSYYQTFNIEVNTLPGAVKVAVGNKILQPGKDYLVEPGSPSVHGSFKLKYISEEDMEDPNKLIRSLKKEKKTFVVFPPYDRNNKNIVNLVNFLRYEPTSPVDGIIELTDDKLTWYGATWQAQRPSLIIQRSAFPEKAEKLTLNIKAEFEGQYETQNVIGKITGQSDSVIMITAHYDHLGRMGKNTYFPGANDNASGTALMIDLARHYSSMDSLPYTMIFIAFGAEEVGLLGSRYFVENPLIELNRIKFLLNFDLAGTGDEGIQVVNGSVFKDKFDLLREINDEHNLLPEVKVRGEACNSDHCPFYEKGVPGFFIYTLGGIKAYHDIDDIAETLPLTEYEDYFRLITKFISRLNDPSSIN